jgi:methionine-rich copper-binding protein CopC
VSLNAAKTVATLTPSAPLANNTVYTATLTTGISDLSGNTLAANSTWTFRTALDTTAPTVVSKTPDAGATGVAVGANVVVTFSERVTVPNNAFTLTNLANGRRINAAVSVSANGLTATLNPNANLPAGGQFRVDLTNAIRDAAGNRFAPINWTFRT